MHALINRKNVATIEDIESAMIEFTSRSNGVIREAARYHLGSGGGRVRANLALGSAAAINLPPETTRAISAACELLHNASLVHDDLQDEDAWRRGQLAVWKKYGADTAICLGDMMVSAAYAAIASAPTESLAKLISHMHQRVSDVISGQHDDLQAQYSTVERYNDVARMKSGPLLGLPVELCLIAGNASEHVDAARRASDAIAIAYQTTDDISDVDRDIETNSFNFLALIGGDMNVKTIAARRHAAIYAKTAIEIAQTLPGQTGDGLIRLARKLMTASAVGEAS